MLYFIPVYTDIAMHIQEYSLNIQVYLVYTIFNHLILCYSIWWYRIQILLLSRKRNKGINLINIAPSFNKKWKKIPCAILQICKCNISNCDKHCFLYIPTLY